VCRVTYLIPLPGTTEEPGRPRTVSAASVLLFVCAAIMLLEAVSIGYQMATFDALADRAARATGTAASELASEKSAQHVGGGVGITLVVLIAAALVLLGVLVRRRSQPARVFAAIACVGLLLCCSATIALNYVPFQSDALEQEVGQLQSASQPAWVSVVDTVQFVLYPLLLTVFVLLLVPASNRWYRRYLQVPDLPGYGWPPATGLSD